MDQAAARSGPPRSPPPPADSRDHRPPRRPRRRPRARRAWPWRYRADPVAAIPALPPAAGRGRDRYGLAPSGRWPAPAGPRRAGGARARATTPTRLHARIGGGGGRAGGGWAAGWGPAVTEPIGVYSMYRLFSQMNSTGSDQTAALLSASWKAPMLVAPSPKKATATWPDPLSLADQAAPAASRRCAPPRPREPS